MKVTKVFSQKYRAMPNKALDKLMQECTYTGEYNGEQRFQLQDKNMTIFYIRIFDKPLEDKRFLIIENTLDKKVLPNRLLNILKESELEEHIK